MIKKRIITIAGKPGSGKSTTSKNVASQLGYEHFSSGDLFRAIARDRGVDVAELNIVAEGEKDIDYLVDQKLRDIGASQEEVAIDSRMAWHWMPNSFKVYLDLDLEVAADRIIQNIDEERFANEHIPHDVKEYADILRNRLDSEIRRYMDLYQVSPYDTNNYDLVVDTGVNNPEQVLDLIIKKYKEWLESN
jgi:cytidylate kinase